MALAAALNSRGVPSAGGGRWTANAMRRMAARIYWIAGSFSDYWEIAACRAAAFRAWFKTCHFQVTPETDKSLIIRGFSFLGVTLT
jgi:hypothetical protein